MNGSVTRQSAITVRQRRMIKLDENFKEDMSLVMDMIADFIRQHIKSGSPDWPELSSDTVRQRIGRLTSGGSSAGLKGLKGLNVIGGGLEGSLKITAATVTPLIDTGFLLEHATEGVDISEEGKVGRIWTGYDVARWQDQGNKKIPARKFFYLTKEEKLEIKEVLRGAIIKKWTTTATR